MLAKWKWTTARSCSAWAPCSTGITHTNPLPKINYEVTLKAMKIDGSDFFCGLTFPVNDAFCTLIAGGWGGGLVGLSSLDNYDASENETSTFRGFEKKRWDPSASA